MSLQPRGDYLLLFDASSYIHRSYFALPKITRPSDGLQTGALAGWCWSLMKLTRLNYSAIGKLPSHCAIITDVRGKNWRHDIYPEYKANRKGYEADLEAQLPWIPKIAEAFGIPCIGSPGYEADDTIATYAYLSEEEGLDCVVATSDKDLYALVRGGHPSCIIYDAMKDKGRQDCAEALVGPNEVRKKFGVWPHQISDFLAIKGDTVDNVPGIPKFGDKTAARLLDQFGDIDKMIEEADWGADSFAPKEHAKIIEYRRSLILSRELTALDNDVEVPFEIEELRLREAKAQTLRGLFIDLDLMHLVPKVDRSAA